MAKNVFGVVIVFLFVSSLLLGFQNCSQSFIAADSVVGLSNLASQVDPLKNQSSLALASNGTALNTYAEPCDPEKGWICMSVPLLPQETTVGAWYSVYWYAKGGPIDHWADWTRYEPTLGYYDSGDIIKKQEPYFERAGINYLILDNTNGWGNDNGQIMANIRQVFDQLDHKYPVALAGGAPLWVAGPGEGSKSPQDVKAARSQAMRAEADTTLYEVAQRPNYLKWFDPATNTYKPLLVVYNDIQSPHPNDEINRYWKDSRFAIRYSAGIMDGSNSLLQPYILNEGGLWGWAVRYPQPVNSETMAVQAGHNTSHLASHAGTSTPVLKNNGQGYMQQWLQIIKNKPRNIIIPSWNDWGEETAIEPGRRRVSSAEMLTDAYGEEVDDWLLQITEAYTNLRKGLMPNTYYRTEDDATVYKVESGKLVAQSVMPRRKPVILLPAGTLKPYLSTNVGGGVEPAPGPSPISGGWSQWRNVGGCSKTCDGGLQTQIRTCTSPSPAYGGAVCSGSGSQQVACNTQACSPEAATAPIPEGLFAILPNIYYSNGSAYCYFPSMEHFTLRTGRTNAEGIRLVPSIPAVMRNDGLCQ